MTPEQERAKLDTTLRSERDWAVKNERPQEAEEYRDFSAECDEVRRKMRAKVLEMGNGELQNLYYRSITLSEHEAARRVWNKAREVLQSADELFRANPYQEIDNLRETVRAIELAVDGLNTKAFTQKPETQAALDRIKKHCRDALGE